MNSSNKQKNGIMFDKTKPIAELVTDDEIKICFENTNFGHTKYRELLEISTFKKLVGYHCGHTIEVIMKELGLIGKTGVVTKKGKRLVAKAYYNLMIL